MKSVAQELIAMEEAAKASHAATIPSRREIPRNALEHARRLADSDYIGGTVKIPKDLGRWLDEYLYRLKRRGTKRTKQELIALALQCFVAEIEADEGIIEIDD